ncbi:hypothetical protein A2797_02680 [candidate division WWE3 bacterium RIFCSPHIGHO2_01_FULL_48_15]|uniref:YtxH domain-containing protein n=1 Tax=candidate division WWE3 bacterium RIFCSPHIGHO2_01_FULL_48_15 TaxID=1802619 RepID=A0A1F4VG73_UNCKA|nr:MAG: hypothetical protein A2797_02680 [candidate division WWE3 bacterium RIFCSPHIGHO2_01_FULL_48_15]
MTKQNQKQQDKEKGGFNPLAAAITGAIVGAGVAIAGAVALKDKKNQARVKQAFANVKDQAIGYMKNMRKDTQSKGGTVGPKPPEGQK